MNYEYCPKCEEKRARGEKIVAVSQNIPGGVLVGRETVVSVNPDGSWQNKCLICGFEWTQRD